MNEADFKALVSGQKRGVCALILRGLLRGLSWGYGSAVFLRNRLFDWGWKTSHRVDVPVVSVGNITTGGTGKTPMVAFLVNWFCEQGIKPVILSRGYRAADGGANDEKLVLDQLCPGVPHWQQPDRVDSARRAILNDNAQVLILDDGFQHRRLVRDLDVVLIDATNPWGYNALLPRGLLREPTVALRRADVAIITRADSVTDEVREEIRQRIEKLHPGLPCGEVAFVPRRLINAAGETSDFPAIQHQTAVAVCGIGNPDGFFRTLKRCGVVPYPMRWMTFPDHHQYTASDLKAIGQFAQDQRGKIILTTQKDLVKIPETHLAGVPVWALEIGVEWLSDPQPLLSRLEQLHADSHSC